MSSGPSPPKLLRMQAIDPAQVRPRLAGCGVEELHFSQTQQSPEYSCGLCLLSRCAREVVEA